MYILTVHRVFHLSIISTTFRMLNCFVLINYVYLRCILRCMYPFFTDVSFPAFSMEACRTMICLLDKDHSGSLEYEEFKTLLNYISKWKVCTKIINSGGL